MRPAGPKRSSRRYPSAISSPTAGVNRHWSKDSLLRPPFDQPSLRFPPQVVPDPNIGQRFSRKDDQHPKGTLEGRDTDAWPTRGSRIAPELCDPRRTRLTRYGFGQTEAPCQPIEITAPSPTTQVSWPGGRDDT